MHANVNIAIKPPLAMIADDISSFQDGQTIGFNFKFFIVNGICHHIATLLTCVFVFDVVFG